MPNRLTRFLNLERPRTRPEAQPHEVATRARFSGEEPAAAEDDASFRAQREARLRSGLEVATGDSAAQPFLRCPVCEADNSRYALKCINCEGRLDTPAVQEWNARLWAARRAQADSELPPPPPPPLAAHQEPKTYLAQQGEPSMEARPSPPWGRRLLAMIPDGGTRLAASVAVACAFFGSALVAYLARRHPLLQMAAIAFSVALLFLFTPASRRRSWTDED